MTIVHDMPTVAGDGLNLPLAAEMRETVHFRRLLQAAEQQRKCAAAAEAKKHQRDMFLAGTLTPDSLHRVALRIREAAESGATSLMVGHFPCEWCTDRGRLIDASDAGWPATLQGIAREFFVFWQHDLQPRGFDLQARLRGFPEGMPDDVGIFLSWGNDADGTDGMAVSPSHSHP